MGYTKTDWVAGTTPLSEANLDHLETQYDEVGNLFDAHSLLIAIADNTPVALALAASRIVGRAAAGNIVALTGAQVLTIIGRIGKSNLEWTNAKLLLGAGAGSDPTEIDVPTTVQFDTTVVFNSGTAPTNFTDLDLSGVVGSNQAVVLLKFKQISVSAAQGFTTRKNGDADVFEYHGAGGAGMVIGQNESVYLLTVTDASGIIEWEADLANTTTITMEAYLKL